MYRLDTRNTKQPPFPPTKNLQYNKGYETSRQIHLIPRNTENRNLNECYGVKAVSKRAAINSFPPGKSISFSWQEASPQSLSMSEVS